MNIPIYPHDCHFITNITIVYQLPSDDWFNPSCSPFYHRVARHVSEPRLKMIKVYSIILHYNSLYYMILDHIRSYQIISNHLRSY